MSIEDVKREVYYSQNIKKEINISDEEFCDILSSYKFLMTLHKNLNEEDFQNKLLGYGFSEKFSNNLILLLGDIKLILDPIEVQRSIEVKFQYRIEINLEGR